MSLGVEKLEKWQPKKKEKKKKQEGPSWRFAEMLRKFPPWSLGRVLQLRTRKLCLDNGSAGVSVTTLFALLPVFSLRPVAELENDTIYIIHIFSFGPFHFSLLLWSHSSDEESGSCPSNRCINECKTDSISMGGSFDPGKKSSWTVVFQKVRQAPCVQFGLLLWEGVRKPFPHTPPSPGKGERS